jgi:hypothetical protein
MMVALVVYHAALAAGHDFVGPVSSSGFQVMLLSGARVYAGWNEAMLAGGLALLFLELLKSTRTTRQSTLEHILSVLVFIVFLVEFIVVPGAGTAVFGLLGLMSLIDLMAGYAISIAVARRDLNIAG